MRRMILPLMLFAAIGCQPPEQQATTTGPDVEAVTARVEQYTTAVSAGDIEGWAALSADEGA